MPHQTPAENSAATRTSRTTKLSPGRELAQAATEGSKDAVGSASGSRSGRSSANVSLGNSSAWSKEESSDLANEASGRNGSSTRALSVTAGGGGAPGAPRPVLSVSAHHPRRRPASSSGDPGPPA